MPPKKKTRTTSKRERGLRSPRGHISQTVVPSKQPGQLGSIRINVPGKLRENSHQEALLLGLPATRQNLADVEEALKKINARIHTFKDLNVKELTKEELKNHILDQLGLQTAKSRVGPTLDTLFLDYMTYQRLILGRSKSTLSGYETTYNVVIALETKDISQSTKILEELAKLEYSVRYCTLQTLSACCNWAVEEGKIGKNPFLRVLKNLKEPTPTDEAPDPFSRQAMERTLDAYRHHPRYHHYADLIEFYFLTGARTGEAVALLCSDIDFEKGVIHIRKTIAHVRGKPDERSTTKTGKNREFPIEDPALEKLLRRVCSNKKPSDFVFQESDGSHIDRNKFYYSWFGHRGYRKLKDGTQKETFSKGIVSKLAALGEANGGIDYYRPQYNTRHTFISLAIEGLIELNESTMRDVVTLAQYVGNSADVILEHYLGRSGKRKIVVISRSQKESEAPNSDGKDSQPQSLPSQQMSELEQRNSRLQIALQSLVQFTHTVLLQFVPETLRPRMTEFVKTLVPTHLLNLIVDQAELPELDEEIVKCAAWLTLESNSDS
jgi:integrase